MYFKILPNLSYLKYDKNPYSGNFVTVKNFFIRPILSEFVEKYITIFDEYIIEDNQRPDNIAYAAYGNPFYDWVILTVNNICDIYEQWPRTKDSLLEYCNTKYSNVYDIHHYETIEYYDSNKNLVLPAGLEVPSNFTFSYSDNNVTYNIATKECVISISNIDYETKLNENKRKIKLLKSKYLGEFESTVGNILSYTPSTQYIDVGNKIVGDFQVSI